VVDGVEINDLANIAEHFNTYFANIGHCLAQKYSDHDSKVFLKFLRKRTPESIFLEPTCPIEVFNEINSLNTFSTLCNFSFSLGIFPENMKIAKVVPLFKTGRKSEVSNYKPISILTCLSKIIEKLTYAKLINFFNKHSILLPNQYGFRRGLSTNHALLDVVTTSYDNIDKLLQTMLIFIDYKKAFDTVCHQILLSKLEHYGV